MTHRLRHGQKPLPTDLCTASLEHSGRDSLKNHLKRWGTALFVIVLVALLTSCGPSEKTPEPTINIPADVLKDKSVLSVKRLDTDNDGNLEWLVFYRFDQVEGRGPVAALIYDVAANLAELPQVYPYKVHTPEENYLARVEPKAEMIDPLPGGGGSTGKDLLFSTDYELAFFRVNRSGVNRPSDNPPLYRCIGFFRSDGGVYFNRETRVVTVSSSAGYERSQLVTKHYYRPEADGYFITGTTILVSPFDSTVDFAEGVVPPAILDTPYPEKIALAFYKSLGQQDAITKTREYLSTQAVAEFDAGKLRYGSPYPLADLQGVVVKEIGYYPTQEDSQSTTVIVKAVFIRKNGERSPLIEVRWTVVRDPYRRWKMHFPQL